ncbi:MAG: hypothetical protein Q7R34_13530, partial [Dehalococcoidia bacterium]|nr:hypothetical protein [Dehalococcoidia bacterium]
MKRWLSGGLIISIVFVIVALAACTPKATPVTSTQAPTAPTTPASPTSNVSPPTSQDAAWDKVVEAAKKEGKINFYNWYFTEGRGGRVLEQAFEAKYGIELSAIQGRGAEFTERLKTEKRIGQMVADVVEGSSLHMENMRLAELLKPTIDMPVMKEKDVWH